MQKKNRINQKFLLKEKSVNMKPGIIAQRKRAKVFEFGFLNVVAERVARGGD